MHQVVAAYDQFAGAQMPAACGPTSMPLAAVNESRAPDRGARVRRRYDDVKCPSMSVSVWRAKPERNGILCMVGVALV